VQVTGADPFATCTKDNVHRQETAFGSVLYPNTAIEPWVAVDPTDQSRLLVGHQQDRWSDGGARGPVGVVSNDGGSSWTDTIPQDVTRCTGGKGRSGQRSLDGVRQGRHGVLHVARPQSGQAAKRRSARGTAELLMSRSTRPRRDVSAPIALITKQLAACAQRQELGDRRPVNRTGTASSMRCVGSIERLPADP